VAAAYAEPEPQRDGYPLSRFLAICHRLLRRDHGIRFVVTFSDPAHGRDGTIYRASNFEHLGKTDGERHVVDGKGQLRPRRMVRHHAKRSGTTQAEARAKLGLKVQRTVRRDRWFIDLGSRRPGVTAPRPGAAAGNGPDDHDERNHHDDQIPTTTAGRVGKSNKRAVRSR
jgi:hypothetical protein